MILSNKSVNDLTTPLELVYVYLLISIQKLTKSIIKRCQEQHHLQDVVLPLLEGGFFCCKNETEHRFCFE